jgi:hypothetical protein
MLTRRPSRLFLAFAVISVTIFLIQFFNLLQDRTALQPEENDEESFRWRLEQLESHYQASINEAHDELQIYTTTVTTIVEATQSPTPSNHFDNCDRCLVYPEWCKIFGSKNLDLSIAHEGTYIRRLLEKI